MLQCRFAKLYACSPNGAPPSRIRAAPWPGRSCCAGTQCNQLYRPAWRHTNTLIPYAAGRHVHNVLAAAPLDKHRLTPLLGAMAPTRHPYRTCTAAGRVQYGRAESSNQRQRSGCCSRCSVYTNRHGPTTAHSNRVCKVGPETRRHQHEQHHAPPASPHISPAQYSTTIQCVPPPAEGPESCSYWADTTTWGSLQSSRCINQL